MTEQLPITINIHNDLIEKLPKIKSIINKLEAQFNFQTLTANWYGDEEYILLINLILDTPTSFEQYQLGLAEISHSDTEIKAFSDDVICSVNEKALQIACNIAITDSELALLDEQAKLLTAFLQAKLHKVLNLIAEQQSLVKI
jgi:hypothetical protein